MSLIQHGMRSKPARTLALLGAGALLAAGLLAGEFLRPHIPEAQHSMAEHDPMPASQHEAEAARPATVVRPVSCEKLPHVPGKSITTAVVEFPPNAYSPRHRHPGSVTAYVLRGTLRSQMEGTPVGTYRAGETWFEPPGAIHLFAENASATETAELLAIFIADDDCGPLVIPD